MKKQALPRVQFSQVITVTNHHTDSVTVYKDGRFGMNPKLAAELAGKQLHIAFTEDGRHCMLEELEPPAEGIRFSKSGYRKLQNAVDLLKRLRIELPARYEVWLTEDGFRQGDLQENPMRSQSKRPRSSKQS